MDYYFKMATEPGGESFVRAVSGEGYSVHGSHDNGVGDGDAFRGVPVWDSPGWNRCDKETAQGILGFDLEGEDSCTHV